MWLKAEAAAADVDEEICPVCERPILLAELTRLVDAALEDFVRAGGIVAELDQCLVTRRQERDAAKAALERLSSRREAVDRAVGEEAQAANQLAQGFRQWTSGLPSEPDALELPLAELSQKAVEAIHAAIGDGHHDQGRPLPSEPLDGVLRKMAETAEQARDQARRELLQRSSAGQEHRRRVLSLGALLDFLDADERLNELDEVVRGEALERALAALGTVGSTIETVAGAAEIAAIVSSEEAKTCVERIEPRLNTWFGRLSRHDQLRSARVTTDSRRDAGGIRNTYRIRAYGDNGWEVGPGPMLSGGYQTVLAVAALCALAEDQQSAIGLHLLVLDEPTQSLDPVMTETMGRALGTSFDAARLLLTTTEESFATALIDSAGASRVRLLRLSDWTAARGTALVETS